MPAVQIAANWQIDQYRFWGAAIPSTNVVIATTVDGAYGYDVPGDYAIDASGYTGDAVLIGNENDTAAVSAVSAVGSAVRNIRIPPESNGSVAALAGYYCDLRSVNKHMVSLTYKNGPLHCRSPKF